MEHWDIRKMKTAKKEIEQKNKRGPEILGLRCQWDGTMGEWVLKCDGEKVKRLKAKNETYKKQIDETGKTLTLTSHKLPASFVMERKPLPLLSCQQISVMFEQNLHRN